MRGAEYGGAREDCPICEDERQYVGWGGQRWTSLSRNCRRSAIGAGSPRKEPNVIGVGADPPTAIGQRALLVRTAAGNVLWDMITYLDDDLVQQVNDLGGVSAIAVSHPHFYGSMIEWAHAFDAPVYIHESDRQWVARPDESVVYWSGATCSLGDGVPMLINAGVHFDGGQVLHWADGEDGSGALFSGDIFTVVSDRRWVSFMYSYPNHIPEAAANSPAGPVADGALPSFSRVYGAWWNRIVDADGAAAIRRSADRYLKFALDDG